MVQLQNVSADTNPGVICPKSGLKIQNFIINLRQKKDLVYYYYVHILATAISIWYNFRSIFENFSPCDWERCKKKKIFFVINFRKLPDMSENTEVTVKFFRKNIGSWRALVVASFESVKGFKNIITWYK